MLTYLIACLLSLPLPTSETPALRGLDPVALCAGDEVPGLETFELRWGAYTYRFEDEAARERFRAEPERYCIQWDGGCARMGPLSGKGDAQRWAVHAGRLYIFASDGCREGFLAAPERFLPAARKPLVASEAQRAQGARWLARALEAHGGEAVDALGAARFLEMGEVQGWQSHKLLQMTREGAVAQRTSWTPPAGQGEPSDDLYVLTEAESFACQQGQCHELGSPAAREDVRRRAQREPLFLFWARHAPGFEAIALGPGRLGERVTDDLLVRHQGLETHLHLEPESGLILGLAWTGRAASGVTSEVVETFAGWKSIHDVNLAFQRDVLSDGKQNPSLSGSWTTMELLEAAPADAFRRP